MRDCAGAAVDAGEKADATRSEVLAGVEEGGRERIVALAFAAMQQQRAERAGGSALATGLRTHTVTAVKDR